MILFKRVGERESGRVGAGFDPPFGTFEVIRVAHLTCVNL